MFRDKISGIAVAATLGTATLLGATHANAVIDLDATDKSKPAVLFASELIGAGAATITGVGDNQGMQWFALDEENDTEFDFTVKLGHNALTSDSITVMVELTNMVFGGDLVVSLAGGGNADGTTPATGSATGLSGKSSAAATLSLARGVASDALITIALNGTTTNDVLGILGSGNGTVSVTIENVTAARSNNPIAAKTATYESAIDVATALVAMAMPRNETAFVETGFESLLMTDDPERYRTEANVGKIEVGLASPAPRNPAGGAVATLANILSLTGDAATGTNVVVSGEFGFATMGGGPPATVTGVTLDPLPTCASATTDTAPSIPLTFTATEPGMSSAYGLASGSTGLNHYLCIQAATGAAFPSTEAYTVAVDYVNTAGTPMQTDVTLTLGMIKRSGTTIRIPYLTTYSGYNQRLVLVNRGDETSYEITFMPEDGIMADPESMEGTLPSGTSMMLTRNIVNLSGGSRTAASITVDASPSMIDAATVTVNKMDGSTDTVTHTGN